MEEEDNGGIGCPAMVRTSDGWRRRTMVVLDVLQW